MIRNFVCIAILLSTGCSMGRIMLNGEHTSPPPIQESTVEVPFPRINVVSIVRSKINTSSLPRDEQTGEIIIRRLWYRYWPNFPVVSLQPGLISARVPYSYAYKIWVKKCEWRWRGFYSGVYCWWELADDSGGSAEVGFDSSFKWTPAWNLEFSTKPVYPGGKLGEYLVGVKLDNIAGLVNAELNNGGQLRSKFDEYWKAMFNPIELGDGAWLTIDPNDAWVTPINTSGDLADFSIGISAKPKVEYAKPDVKSKELPVLKEQPTKGGNVLIALEGKISFKDASHILLERVKNMEFPSRLGTVKIVGVDVYGLNKKLVIGTKVETSLGKGWIYLSGDLEYRSINYTFMVRNLQLEVQTLNPLVRGFAWLFDGQFESVLEEQAYWRSRNANEGTKALIEKRFNEAMAGRPNLRVISLRPLTANNRQVLFTTPDSINVVLIAGGKLYQPE